jgi:hypothetical protein
MKSRKKSSSLIFSRVPQRKVKPKIKKRRPSYVWTAADAALLGTMSDADAARQIGVSQSHVSNVRVRLNIPAFKPIYRIERTNEILSLLGKVSDAKISQRFGIAHTPIALKRKELGIAPFKQPAPLVQWSDDMLAMLGTQSDASLSRLWGVSGTRIQAKRTQLKIPACPTPEWTADKTALLGTASDKELAKLWGFSAHKVSTRRTRLGIAAHHHKSPNTVWTPEMMALLGTDADSVIAARLNLPHTVVHKKRAQLGIKAAHATAAAFKWTDDTIALLGKHSDATIGKQLGIHHACVGDKRRLLGIKAYLPPHVKPPKARTRTIWTDAMLNKLGADTDRALAQLFGIGTKVVCLKRHALGIAPYGKTAQLNQPKTKVIHSESQLWSEQYLSMLGTVPDEDLAKQMGITKKDVRFMRIKRLIKQWQPD